MKTNRIPINEYIGSVNLEQLLSRQEKIFDRFDTISESFNTEQPRIFIQSLDAYILHVIEEVYEFYETSFSDPSELVDLFNYLLTLNTIFYKLSPTVPEVDFIDSITYSSSINLPVILHEINSKLIKMRRLYPERKWHTSDTSEIDFEKINLSKILLIECLYGVFLIASILPFLDLSPKKLVDLSEAKVQKVLKAAPKNSKREK